MKQTPKRTSRWWFLQPQITHGASTKPSDVDLRSVSTWVFPTMKVEWRCWVFISKTSQHAMNLTLAWLLNRLKDTPELTSQTFAGKFWWSLFNRLLHFDAFTAMLLWCRCGEKFSESHQLRSSWSNARKSICRWRQKTSEMPSAKHANPYQRRTWRTSRIGWQSSGHVN